MLVHTQKSKRPSCIPVKQVLSSNISAKKKPHTNATNQIRQNTAGINNDVNEQKEFSRNQQRSEKVLQAITSAIADGDSIILSPLSERRLIDTEITNGVPVMRARKSKQSNVAMQRDTTSRQQQRCLEQNNPLLKTQSLNTENANAKKQQSQMAHLKQENRALKNHLMFVYNQRNDTTSLVNEKDQTILLDKTDEKQLKRKKIALQKRYEEAVLKYRLEMFQKRSADYKELKEAATSYLEYISVLEDVLIDLKVENCSKSTAYEDLRLKVETLQDQHVAMTNYINNNLKAKVDDTLKNFHVRLEKAFENLHKLKCANMQKKFRLFRK
ncbi:uncharacterized protein LOC130648498 [Hydractinia symbiolongicarpus]|uniref:uncharacterized protein LOC130648498 n=1 Tax=Hydractinia symbiolongicarpus TaxID=13093 RepID=UPI00254F94D4|nr:uncharacterized protein LOC130648498 [Hydractinia symbiolongicarpus]